MVTVSQSFVPQFTPSAYSVPRAGADGRLSALYVPDLSATYQPLAEKLTSLAGMNTTQGLVEQNGDDSFTKRLIGVANSTDIPTRADADARYEASDADLTAIAALTGTGIAGRTASNTWALSSLTTGRLARYSAAGVLSDSYIQDSGSAVGVNGVPIAGTRITVYGATGLGMRISANGNTANQLVIEDIDDSAIPSTARPFTVIKHGNSGLGSISHSNRSAGNSTTSTRAVLAWDENQNILIGTTLARPTAGAGCFVFSTSTTALSPATDQCGFWAADQAAGNRAIRWITENGQNGTLYTQAFVAAPSGGGTQDAEARTAINSLRTILINCGLMAAA